ncbi:hypothetical protein, partial [Corallococcus llansteffanensis]
MLRSFLGLCCCLVLLVPARAPALMQDAPTRIQETYLEDPESDTGEGTAVQDEPEVEEAEEPEPEPRRPTGRG